VILANLSSVLPNLPNSLPDFGSAAGNLLRTSATTYIPAQLSLVFVELSHIPAQFRAILE
jgi:hypothetical protein